MQKADYLPLLFRGLDSRGKEQVSLACNYAQQYLSNIHRRSGEDYALHGCEVAVTLRELTSDPSMLAVAALHDLLVHPDGDALLASSSLNESEKELVRRMHPLRRLHIDANTEDLDLVINAFTEDARLLPLRMAHRLNDVRHLSRFTKTLKRQIATETLHMYTAIASRLGMHSWRYEMEDACFRLLQPSIVSDLEKKFASHAVLDAACLQHAKRFLAKKLRQENIETSIDGRIKQLYSTYRKMVIKKRRFEELTDRLALRIIVPTLKDCYHTLGIVHASFHPIPGKLKDYIGAPKENGYRSIHTVVYPLAGVTEQSIEIQIRTAQMNDECEYGIAKHGEYKSAVYALHSQPSRVHLFRNLQSLREEARSPKQFETALRTYFNEDHIVLFDNKNSLYHLKQPVTALDFACHVYGRRCRRLQSTHVNGRERPIDTPLRDGDTLQVRFSKDERIQRTWIDGCRHTSSKKLLRKLIHDA
jgi:GTP pyrophosphokinase